jgi:chorismate synthase
MSFRFLTAGESHGPQLTAIIEGLPAGLNDPTERINRDIGRRQLGYGRGKRMSIEQDKVEITAGIIKNKTYGAPLCLQVKNIEYPSRSPNTAQAMHVPRPGHADLAGALKYNTQDVMPIWERSSARETAIRTAVGSVAKELLAVANIKLYSHVIAIGEVTASIQNRENIAELAEASMVRCIDSVASEAMCRAIDQATEEGDTLGGIIEVAASGVPAGLGSCMHWDQRLDGKIAQLLMSIPSVKAVSIGEGIENAARKGSRAHDLIQYSEERGFTHPTNAAGGIEGGITNGEEIICRAYCKPIPTLRSPLSSVDLVTKEPKRAPYKRSDVCVIPAAAVIAESLLAIALADVFLARFGADTIEKIMENGKWIVDNGRRE